MYLFAFLPNRTKYQKQNEMEKQHQQRLQEMETKSKADLEQVNKYKYSKLNMKFGICAIQPQSPLLIDRDSLPQNTISYCQWAQKQSELQQSLVNQSTETERAKQEVSVFDVCFLLYT